MTKRLKRLWASRTGPIPEEEAKALAMSIVQGGEWHYVAPTNWRDQFIFLTFINWREYYKADVMQLGAILGEAQQIAPRSVNGLAVYMGGRLVHKEDWELIAAKVKAIQEAIETA